MTNGWSPGPPERASASDGEPATEILASGEPTATTSRPTTASESAAPPGTAPELVFASLDEPPPPRTPSRTNPRLVAAILVALVAIAAGALIWSSHSRGGLVVGPAKVTVRGTIILTDSGTLLANCIGRGGYSDMRAGASVVLTNESGKVLGRASLQRGQPDYDDQICSYPFTILDVPSNQQGYAVEVSDRGKIVKSRAELAQSGWTYFLALT